MVIILTLHVISAGVLLKKISALVNVMPTLLSNVSLAIISKKIYKFIVAINIAKERKANGVKPKKKE